MTSWPSLELFWLFEALDEVLASLLSVDLEKVGVEVWLVLGQRIVPPQTRVFVVDFANVILVMLLSVHLELFRQRCLHGGLQLLDLLSVVSMIVEDLPLLDCAFVHFKLFLSDLFGTDDFFDPVLKLELGLAHAPVI